MQYAVPIMLAFPTILIAASALATPQFDHQRGWRDDAFTLDITAQAVDGVIYYSDNGDYPSTVWTGPISIDPPAVIRTIEVSSTDEISIPVTHTYLNLDTVLSNPVMHPAIMDNSDYGPVVADTLMNMPFVALTFDANSISQTEIPVVVEWVEPDGDTFQVDAGAKVVGNASVNYQKNNIRLYFRGEYGYSKLEYDLFDNYESALPAADTHDSLNLRSGSHDSVFYLGATGQYLRNIWMDESQLQMGHIAPHGRYAHLFKNGVYDGVYHIRERFNAAFLAEYMGGDKDDYEAINGGVAFDGSGAAWAQAIAHAGNYQEFKRWVNVPAYLDYMILQYYAANDWDWLYYHNWMAAGPASPDEFGFTFHSSDSDICLYYDYTKNILDLYGPDNILYYLLDEADPAFMTLFADRIHRQLESDGPLTANRAGERYADVSAQIEQAVVAESARWGNQCCGLWDRDDEWQTEQDRLMNDFFPFRTAALLQQMREAGWYPLDAPIITPDSGLFSFGTTVNIAKPTKGPASGVLYYTLDGTDPQSSSATGPVTSAIVEIDSTTIVKARLNQNNTWGPLEERFIEIDAPAAVILNEWNAVSANNYLDDNGEDTTLGQIMGNGGDWLELLVMEDIDMRGWMLTMTSRGDITQTLTLTDDPLWANLRAGTLITIANQIPEDPTYDPTVGDWRFNVRAAQDGTGQYISAADFDVHQREWRLTISTSNGRIAYGPAGETIAPKSGLSASEVGQLAVHPTTNIRRTSQHYNSAKYSSFGAPNQWDGQQQDLSALRGDPTSDKEPPPPPIQDTATDDTALALPPPTTDPPNMTGCGCRTGRSSAPLALGLFAGLLVWRRRRVALVLALTGCAGPHTDTTFTSTTDTHITTETHTIICFTDNDKDGFGNPDSPIIGCPADSVTDDQDCNDQDALIHPGMPEVCDGLDNDCDDRIDADDDDLADGLLFYTDADSDGYGTEPVSACQFSDILALVDGDCDDTDDTIYPGATELCDDIDQDCDGLTDDSLGVGLDCPADTCATILAVDPTAADGAYFLTINATVRQHWCDMTTEGGGWTLGFIKNSVDADNYGDFGHGARAPESLAVSPNDASNASDVITGWMDLNHGWSELMITSHADGAQSYASRPIPTDALRIPFGQNGYYLYDEGTGYYWCGGDASYTDAGLGAVNNPPSATNDCKGHSSVGSGWDFSESTAANAGLTLCGNNASAVMHGTWAGGWYYYGYAGAAQAIWVR